MTVPVERVMADLNSWNHVESAEAVRAVLDERDRLRDANNELAAAWEPFARAAGYYNDDDGSCADSAFALVYYSSASATHPETNIRLGITYGDLRQARAAIDRAKQ